MFAVLYMLAVVGLNAQNKNLKPVGNKELQEIQKSFVKDAQTAAIQNALTNDKDIKSHVLNHNLKGKIDHFFKYRVNVKGITDQKSSGRCWMFTSMNVLRPAVMEKFNVASFDFSHNYNYFGIF